jgi:hypothetical protein
VPTASMVWWMVVAGLVAAIFVTDPVTPLGFAHGTLYVPVVVLAILSGRAAPVWASAIAGMLLTPVGYFVSPPAPSGIAHDLIVANRMGSVIALLVTLVVGLLLLQARQRLDGANAELRSARDRVDENVRLLEMAADAGRLGAWRVRAVLDARPSSPD